MLGQIVSGWAAVPFAMISSRESRKARAYGVVFTAFLAVLSAWQARSDEARVDQTGPSHPALQAIHDTPVAPYLGDVLLVNFWTSWCPPCIREMPELEALARDMVGRPFRVVMVNVEEPPGIMRRFARLAEAGIVSLRDPNARFAKDWGVTVYPTSFVVDRDGRVVERFVGPADWTSAEWTARFERLMPAYHGEPDALPNRSD